MNQLISIIVPIYNVEKYLDKCIESITEQTYKQIEIILVNDGSTDNSLDICEKWEKNDSRIIIVNKDNGGLSSARNAGLERAKGKYIGFVDSDDWIDADMYESLGILADKHNADIVESKMRYIYKDHAIGDCTNQMIICNNEEALGYFLSNNTYFKSAVVSKLYNRDIFINLQFKEGYIHEDGFFTYQALYKSNKIIYLDKCFYNYLQNRQGSIMTKKFSRERLVILQAYKERTKFLDDKGLKILAKKSHDEYLATLIRFYYQAQKKCKNDEELFESIDKEIRSNYDSVLINENKNIVYKYMLYRLNPKIYYIAEYIKDILINRERVATK